MNTKPITLSSTPVEKKRRLFAVIIYLEEPTKDTSSRLHSIWDTYEDAEKAMLEYRDIYPDLFMECTQVNANEKPPEITEVRTINKNGWDFWTWKLLLKPLNFIGTKIKHDRNEPLGDVEGFLEMRRQRLPQESNSQEIEQEITDRREEAERWGTFISSCTTIWTDHNNEN